MGNKKIDFHTKYAKIGLTVFLSGAALILCFFALFNLTEVKAVIDNINNILFPFYLGLIMAYLLCPIYNATLRRTYKISKDLLLKPERAYTLS